MVTVIVFLRMTMKFPWDFNVVYDNNNNIMHHVSKKTCFFSSLPKHRKMYVEMKISMLLQITFYSYGQYSKENCENIVTTDKLTSQLAWTEWTTTMMII